MGRGTLCVSIVLFGNPSVCRLPFQELTAADCAHELSIARLHLPTHRDDGGAALLLPAFVRVVIDVRVTAFLGKGAAIARIVDDKVGIAAELDSAFSRVEPEELCSLCRTGIHHRLQPQPTRGNAAGMN